MTHAGIVRRAEYKLDAGMLVKNKADHVVVDKLFQYPGLGCDKASPSTVDGGLTIGLIPELVGEVTV
jgi:hypothetical protein